MHKRIILKLSGEAISYGGGNYNNEVLNKIAEQIKRLKDIGTQVTLVIGGGNYWRGRSANPDMDRVAADQIGMLATVMNAMYVQDFLNRLSLPTVIMTPVPFAAMTEIFSKNKALEYLNEGKIIIFAAGLAHPFFSTDTITALRACELEADAILYAKNIDGVYSDDPNINPNAVKYDEIKASDIVEKNLKVIDLTAAVMCSDNKIPVVIFSLLAEDGIYKAATGEKIGTIVTV